MIVEPAEGEIRQGRTRGDNARHEGPPRPGFIRFEETWRARPDPLLLRDGRQASVSMTYFRAHPQGDNMELVSDVDDDAHVLTLLLRNTRADLLVGNKCILRIDRSKPMYITGPKRGLWRARCYTSVECLRVYFPQDLLRECYESRYGTRARDDISLFELAIVNDEIMKNLASCFALMNRYDDIAGSILIDYLGIAFAERLIDLQRGGTASTDFRSIPLSFARMEQVKSYIEEHLGEQIRLSDLSALVGLSRLHFAKQFKAAVGTPPYTYIQRKRIERAQHLLANSSASIVEIALDTGFSSQGHFTDAFRAITGTTPGGWRRAAK